MPEKATLEEFTEEHAANVEAVRVFADLIKQELKSNTAVWWKIAETLGKAEKQYGFGSKHMTELISEVRFSTSKANKLVQISKDKRLADHASKFDTVSAWTVLYKLTTLEKKEFQKVLGSLEDESVVSIAWINEVLGRSKRKQKEFRPLFTVEVNLSALKSQEFDGDQFNRIEVALNTLKDEIPSIEINETGIFEKAQKRFERDWEKARDKALRRLVIRAIEETKGRSKEWNRYNDPKTRKSLNLSPPKIDIYGDEDEVMISALANPSEVFATLDADWFSDELLMSETQDEFEKARKKP